MAKKGCCCDRCGATCRVVDTYRAHALIEGSGPSILQPSLRGIRSKQSSQQEHVVQLAVSDWRPYRHLAAALQQLVRTPVFERVGLDRVSGGLVDSALGPFLALLPDAVSPPLIGVPAIVEALDRKFPERGFLPQQALARASVRQLSAKIEECFVRMSVAAIASHERFGRRTWHAGSDARATILDDYPKRIATLEGFQRDSTSRFLVGDRPTMADCLLAALWWTAEDEGLAPTLAEQPSLRRWHAACCSGDPFFRTIGR